MTAGSLLRPHRHTSSLRVRPQSTVWRAIDPVRFVSGCAGLVVAIIWREWFGTLLVVVAGLALDHLVRRRMPPAVRRLRAVASAQLPFAADLLAAVLRTGAPVDRAAAVVGSAVGGPLGDRLGQVATNIRTGTTLDTAWAPLGDVPGGARLMAAAARTADSGAAFAGALSRLADDLRSMRRAEVEATAERISVLVVLPLGLCFLPAFLLSGVIPVALSVLTDFLTPLH